MVNVDQNDIIEQSLSEFLKKRLREVIEGLALAEREVLDWVEKFMKDD